MIQGAQPLHADTTVCIAFHTTLAQSIAWHTDSGDVAIVTHARTVAESAAYCSLHARRAKRDRAEHYRKATSESVTVALSLSAT